MAQCTKCGTINPDGSFYCKNCGFELKPESYQPINRPVASAQISEQPSVPQTSQTREEKPAKSYYEELHEKEGRVEEASAVKDITNPDNYKLKWHKWLVNFVFWLWALSNARNAIDSFTLGLALLGIIFAAITGYEIYTRFQLARFKTGAVNKLIACLVINLVITIVFAALNPGDTTNGPQIVISIAWLIGNWRYYSTRKALFVN